MSKSAAGATDPRLNFQRVTTLLIEPSQAEQNLLAQILHGFGMRDVRRCQEIGEAPEILNAGGVGLIVLTGSLANGRSYDFVRWLRREATDQHRFLPVLMLNGHVNAAQVCEARDCGASYLITKPISPRVLLDRIAWLSREARSYLAIDGGYVGPDRRFRKACFSEAGPRRRRDDKSEPSEASPQGGETPSELI